MPPVLASCVVNTATTRHTAVSADAVDVEDEDEDEYELAEQMKRLGLPTEFGAAKRHKQQQPSLSTATAPSSTSSSAFSTTTDVPPASSAIRAVGRGSKAARKRGQQQLHQQRSEDDAGQRWQRRGNRPDVWGNPSYVGRALVGATETDVGSKELEQGGESKQAGEEVQVEWEEDEEADAEWQWHRVPSDQVVEEPVDAVCEQADAGGERMEWMDGADSRDYQAGVSLYPHGYGRFAEQSTTDGEDGAMDAEVGEGGEVEAAQQAESAEVDERGDDHDEEDEEEHVDDYGLLQGEVLEGEDHTDAPIAAPRRLRGLPVAQGRRVRMDEDGNRVAEQLMVQGEVMGQRVEAKACDETEQDEQLDEQQDERPDELPALISRSPLPAPLSPPSAMSPQPLPSSAPASAQRPHVSVAAATPVPQPLPPPTYPLSLLPTRFTAMAALSAAYDEDKDDEEYVRAHAGEVIEGEDRTGVPVQTASTSVLRGMRRRNKRVVFDADGQQVVAEAAASAQSEQTGSISVEQRERESREQSDAMEQKEETKEATGADDEEMGQGQKRDERETSLERFSSAASQADEMTATGDTQLPQHQPPEPVDPNLLTGEPVPAKYYAQRYRLFSRYDAGIRLDAVGWYSVTPESIAHHIAARIAASVGRPFTVCDAFAGLGGNTIAFASHPLCRRVIAVELSPHRLALARHNAEVYGVGDKCEWVEGDWLQLQRSASVQADVLFLAPPWGGVDYQARDMYKLQDVEVAGGGRQLIRDGRKVRGVEGRVALSLPRNVDVEEVVEAGQGERVEVEYNRCNGKVKTITAYYGDLVRDSCTGSEIAPVAAGTPSFNTVFMDNSSLLRLLAVFLCYTIAPSRHRQPGLDNSLVAFSRCCRRTHSLLSNDGPWWHRQRVEIKLRRPIISRHAWASVPSSSASDSSLGLLARGFTARQQAIVRRLMGDEAYERQVGCKLIAEHRETFECDDEQLLSQVGTQCWRVDEADSDIAPDSGEQVDVYSQLSPHSFLTSSFPCDDIQWLFGCYDAVLLVPSARFIPAVRIVMNMPNALRSEQQVESVFQTLKALPSLVHVRMEWQVSDEDSDAFVCQPRHHCLNKRDDRSLDEFPALRSLHIKNMYLSWRDSFLPIIRHTGLVQLRLSSVTVLGEQQDWARNDVCYRDPQRSCSVTELLAMDAQRAARKNRQLRRALCAFVLSTLSTATDSPALQLILADVHKEQAKLHAEQHVDNAVTSDGDHDKPEVEQPWENRFSDGDNRVGSQEDSGKLNVGHCRGHNHAFLSRLEVDHADTVIVTTVDASPPMSFSAIFIDNKPMLELVATYLCFTTDVSDKRRHQADNSLLAFSCCCRRTHSLLVSDGPWWYQQRVSATLHRPVLSRYAWTCIPGSADSNQHTLALLARAFSPPQQEIARLLMGNEAYQSQVGDKLIAERRVAFECDDGCFLRHVNNRCWHVDNEDDDMAADAGEEVQVYTQLQPASFLTSSFPCNSVEWLFSCYDGVLLPPCVRYIRSARIVLQLPNALATDQQEASKYCMLRRLPALVHLQLDWDGDEDEPFVFQPEWRQHSFESTHRSRPYILPVLRSLHIKDAYLRWIDSFAMILQVPTPIVQLRLERVSVVGWADSATHWSDNDVSFSFPRRLRPVAELLALDTERAARNNRNLRRALSSYILAKLRLLSNEPHLKQLMAECERVQVELSALKEADAAVGWDGGSEGGEEEGKGWEVDDDEDDGEDEKMIEEELL